MQQRPTPRPLTAATSSRKPLLAVFLSVAILASAAGLAYQPLDAGSHMQIVASPTGDHGGGGALDGRTLGGAVYVWVEKVRAGSTVKFWLDDPNHRGEPMRTDYTVFYDLVGTPGGEALPFDTNQLSNGEHSLTVRISYRDRGVAWRTAYFTVANGTATSPTTTTADTTVPTTTTTLATTTTTTAPATTPPTVRSTSYQAPASIAADCSTDVTADLTRWIASVPDNSVLSFAPGGCYRIEDKVIVPDRSGLTFDGNGATFKATTPGYGDRKQWQVYGGSNIAFVDMTVEGVNYTAADGAWNDATEWQHNWSFWGTQGVLLDGVVGRYAWGDFVGLDADYRLTPETIQPVRDVVIRNSTFDVAGRMGVSTNYAERLTIENNRFERVQWSTIDLEVESNDWHIRDIVIRDNIVGWVRHSFIANSGYDAPTDNVTVTGNVMTGVPETNQPPIHIDGGNAPRRGWLIEGNTLVTRTTAVWMDAAADVTIRNNTFYAWNADLAGVTVNNSDGGTVTGNVLNGSRTGAYFSVTATVDRSSGGWTVCGNTRDAVTADPVAC